MLDSQLLRNDPHAVAKALLRRGFILDTDRLMRLEAERGQQQTEQQSLQAQRNRLSKEVGQRKAGGEDVAELMESMASIGPRLKAVEVTLGTVQAELRTLIEGIPNLPHASVPEGSSEHDNVEQRRWGDSSQPVFEAKDHVDLGTQLGMMDFDAASKLTGSRFVVMFGALSTMHRALIQFMLDVHTREHGYRETYVPYLVNERSLFGTGQLPKFEEDQFLTTSDPPYYLIPTAEVPITNLYRDVIVEPEGLPARHVCHTPCFRQEAGSYGKDTRGMIRQHQFEKVELVQLVDPLHSWEALEELTAHAAVILEKLGLPYRVVTLCGGDLGFSAAKTYDLEVWLPGQQRYREISSCSNFEAFQARRMGARWRDPSTGKPALLHTLNGSGLAIGRTLVAVMENYQTADGAIRVPEVLRPYMGGMERIDRG